MLLFGTCPNLRVILDSDPDICGLYPLGKNHEQHYQESIEFIEEQTDLYYLQTEDMNWTTCDNLTGYDLWHRMFLLLTDLRKVGLVVIPSLTMLLR